MRIEMRNPLNRSHADHSVIALGIMTIIMALICPFFGFEAAVVSGMVGAICWFFAGEVDQHFFKGRGPKLEPWYYGLIKHWVEDSRLDVETPALTVLIAGRIWLWLF